MNMITCEFCVKDIEDDVFDVHSQFCDNIQKFNIAWGNLQYELTKIFVKTCNQLTFIVNSASLQLKKLNNKEGSDNMPNR